MLIIFLCFLIIASIHWVQDQEVYYLLIVLFIFTVFILRIKFKITIFYFIQFVSFPLFLFFSSIFLKMKHLMRKTVYLRLKIRYGEHFRFYLWNDVNPVG